MVDGGEESLATHPPGVSWKDVNGKELGDGVGERCERKGDGSLGGPEAGPSCAGTTAVVTEDVRKALRGLYLRGELSGSNASDVSGTGKRAPRGTVREERAMAERRSQGMLL